MRSIRRFKDAKFVQLAFASDSGSEPAGTKLLYAKSSRTRVARGRSPVLGVRDVHNIPQVLDSVVIANAIQMVNLARWPYTVVHEPDDAMSSYGFPTRLNHDVPTIVDIARDRAGNAIFPSEGFPPPKDAIVVVEDGVDIVGADALGFCVSVCLLLRRKFQVCDAIVGTVVIAMDHQTIRPVSVMREPRQMMSSP